MTSIVVNRTSITSGFICSVIFVMSLGLCGCGATNPHPPGTFDRAEFFVEHESFTEAVPALENFVRHNPTDSLAVKAQFMKARSLMALEQYPLAAVEFQILRKDYPNSELVEDAYFYEGVSYFDQVGNIERDVTGSYEARLHFLDFSHEFPNSRYMTEVVEYMQEISDLMVRKRLQQVKIYKQLKRYEAVALILDIVLGAEAGSRILDEVLWRRAEVAEFLEDPETATSMYQRILDEFPSSEYTERAQKSLQKLAGDTPEDS